MEEAINRAAAMHEKYYAADAHFDLGAELYVREKRGEEDILKEYIPQWEKISLRIVVASVFLKDSELDTWKNSGLPSVSALRRTLLQLTLIKEAVLLHEDKMMLIKNRTDLEHCLLSGKTGLVLYLEGLDVLLEDIWLLEVLYELGVRGAALTWSRKNKLATGCCRSTQHEDKKGGITRAGLCALEKMKELGMFVDVSHLNDEGMEQLLKIKDIHVLATHSNCRWLNNHYRNLTRPMAREIVSNGGIIGINANKVLLNGDIRVMAEHIYEMSKVVGPDKVCLGLDLCDRYSEGAREDVLMDYTRVILLTAHLVKLGMQEEEISRIMGKNLVDFLKKVLH